MCLGHCVQFSDLLPSSLLISTLGGSSDSPSNWVSVTHVGGMEVSPGFSLGQIWLFWTLNKLVVRWEFCLSNSQMNKLVKNQRRKKQLLASQPPGRLCTPVLLSTWLCVFLTNLSLPGEPSLVLVSV